MSGGRLITLRPTPFPAKPYQLLPHVRYNALECLRLAIYKPVVTKLRGIFTGLKLQFKRNRVQYLCTFETSKARSSEFKHHTLKYVSSQIKLLYFEIIRHA